MLTWATAFGDGVATADTALIVPGTVPSPYRPLRLLYHFNPAMQPDIGENYINPNATRQIIPYPGSFWPVTGVNSPTIGQSVATGTNNLDAAIHSTNGPIYAAGLSQGTLALDAEQARLANDPHARPPGQITFVKAGDPNNLLTHVFKPGTHVPIIDYTVPHPVDSQYDTVNIVGQYDIFSDPPERMGNLLADLNGITAGGYYGHSATAFSDPARVAPGDITTTINDKGATTTTYLIRADELPLVRALVDMAGLPPEAARPLNAVLKPMVDRAYGPPHAPFPTRVISSRAFAKSTASHLQSASPLKALMPASLPPPPPLAPPTWPTRPHTRPQTPSPAPTRARAPRVSRQKSAMCYPKAKNNLKPGGDDSARATLVLSATVR